MLIEFMIENYKKTNIKMKGLDFNDSDNEGLKNAIQRFIEEENMKTTRLDRFQILKNCFRH